MNPTLKSLPTFFIQAALIATVTTLAIVLVTRYVSPVYFSVSQVTTQKNAAFMVTGKSSIATVPDKVQVTLGVSRKESDLKQAQTDANQIIDSITAKLTDLGIKKEDIKTQNYSIYPTYDYQHANGQNIVGYSVDISLEVSLTDFSKLNTVIDTATASGLNQVGGIQFTLSDAKEKQVRQQARAQAIDDAKANAQELAGLGNMKLGKIINITESNDQFIQPMPYAKDMAVMGGVGAAAPTQIQPGSTNYQYNVTLSYETL